MSEIRKIQIGNYTIGTYEIEYLKRIKGLYGFIYVTTNLLDQKKYVGQRKISSRWEKYLGSGKAFVKAVKKYGSENFKREIIDIAFTKDELDNLELFYTKAFNVVDDRDWYNLMYGGKSPTMIGETKEKLKKYYETHEYPYSKMVAQYDLSGIFIRTFTSAVKAAREYNATTGNMCAACRGEVKSLCGYQWRYCDKDNIVIKIPAYIDSRFSENGRKYLPKISKQEAVNQLKNLNAKRVNQYTLDDIYINTYSSYAEAKRKTGISNRRIAECCGGVRSDYGGFQWFNANDPNQPDKTKIIKSDE